MGRRGSLLSKALSFVRSRGYSEYDSVHCLMPATDRVYKVVGLPDSYFTDSNQWTVGCSVRIGNWHSINERCNVHQTLTWRNKMSYSVWDYFIIWCSQYHRPTKIKATLPNDKTAFSWSKLKFEQKFVGSCGIIATKLVWGLKITTPTCS